MRAAETESLTRQILADLAERARVTYDTWPASDPDGRTYAQGVRDAYQVALAVLDRERDLERKKAPRATL